MDEIAKEYDVVVLGTGESEPKDPDFLLTFFFNISLIPFLPPHILPHSHEAKKTCVVGWKKDVDLESMFERVFF